MCSQGQHYSMKSRIDRLPGIVRMELDHNSWLPAPLDGLCFILLGSIELTVDVLVGMSKQINKRNLDQCKI